MSWKHGKCRATPREHQDDAAMQANTDKQVKIAQDGFDSIGAAQSDWLNGAQKAMANYEDMAANVAGQTQSLFTEAFDGIGDSIANFVKTGKLNFSDLATSILADMTKIETRVALSSALQSIFGMPATGVATSGADSFVGQGVAADIAGLTLNAKGGVYSSPSLSAFSGQIVSSPTMFAFAKGAGLMGEAGPEAIMPLTRGSDGKLGVQSSGAGGTQVQVINNSGGQARTETSAGPGGKDIVRVIIDAAVSEVDSRIMRGGSTRKAMQQTFGLAQRGIPVAGG
jgi:lambda family phage tail tape measure protein